jgi:hypothetical protein
MSAQNVKTENWVSFSKHLHSDLFSELEVLLKALDRFFYVENLPMTQEDLTNRNFYDELTVVRDIIFRVLGILEVVIPENKKNAYWFQRFAESKFLTLYSRDMFKKELYKQDTPEKGLYLLYDLFINLKGIITDLLKTGKISYLGYGNIGQLISKEIRGNNYFNPFKHDINPEFDRIENRFVSQIVKSIESKETKKYISVLYLYLFRFLRYINHIDITSQYSVSLNSSLMILILLRTELNSFQSYIKKIPKTIQDENLRMLLTSIAYQFSMETRRVYLQELREIVRKKAPQHFRGKIENSQGILKNMTEQTIVQLAQFFKPNTHGEDIFDSFTTKLEQSMKLREDIYVLQKFLAILEEQTVPPSERTSIFKSLKNFMFYFESFTFKLLRYDDYDEFASFFHYILSLKQFDFDKIQDKVHNFNVFLETTLRHLSNRSEFSGKPINIDRAEKLFRQYL